MGILGNTVSISHYQVVGDIPSGDLFAWGSERLAKQAFRPIDHGTEELSVGWTHLDDSREYSFDSPSSFWRDHWLAFTLRVDRRKVPASLLKGNIAAAEREFLAANPSLRRVPKQKREEIRELARTALLARVLPVPSTFDAVWDTRSGIVTFASLSPKNFDLFDAHFRRTFEGLRLVPVHPLMRGERVSDPSLHPALAAQNRAGGTSVLQIIRDNRWLGWDFLLWLLYLSLNDGSTFKVGATGPAAEGEEFSAYLDDRLVLTSQGEGGAQKVTVVGPQDHFDEVRTALRGAKRIDEATLHLEQDENAWKMTLKGEMFHFASLRSPRVTIEKDELTDQLSEREAVFYERMALLERGLQLFDSLYRRFLEERLTARWSEREAEMAQWLS